MASSFSRQRNPNMEKALFDWPIVLQYDVKAISRKFFGHEVCLPERSLSQPKPRCVCIRFIHQSNRSISVRLLFLFCSRVFISRSYENRSNVSAVHSHSLKNRIHHKRQTPHPLLSLLFSLPRRHSFGLSRNPPERTSENVTPKTISEGGYLLLFLACFSSVFPASAHFIA